MAGKQKALSPKHQCFVQEYVKSWNRVTAYQSVYPGVSREVAKAAAARLITKDNIAAAIQQHIDEHAMSAGEVLLRLAEQARGSLAPFIVQSHSREDEEGKEGGTGALTNPSILIDLTSESAKAQLHLIKKISQRRVLRSAGDNKDVDETTLTIEIHDPQAALTLLGKHHKLFTDKVDHSGDIALAHKLPAGFAEALAKVYGTTESTPEEPAE